MTRSRRRLLLVLACGVGIGTAAGLGLYAVSDTIVFFVSPTDIATEATPPGRTVRLGGLVVRGSVTRLAAAGRPAARFAVTDGAHTVDVTYTGILPDLFREGQGIVALGARAPDGSFQASEVLAKHDETYMPKEVADALKRSGHWNPDEGPPPPAATWNTLTAPKNAGSRMMVRR
jgi:cytochrome c-type biogenesis protein CcmE